MTTLRDSIDMKNRSAKGGQSRSPEAGGEMGGPTSAGKGGLKNSIPMKNKNITPTSGKEKTTEYF